MRAFWCTIHLIYIDLIIWIALNGKFGAKTHGNAFMCGFNSYAAPATVIEKTDYHAIGNSLSEKAI